MKIVIPMAGRGSRYANAGFETPKPLINVAGRPMLFWALEPLLKMHFSEIILIILETHEEEFKVSRMVKTFLRQFKQKNGLVDPSLSFRLVLIPEVTEGQLCTVLAAKAFINSEEDVLIAASDTYIQSNIQFDILQKPADCSGLISVNSLPGEQWSFARIDGNRHVVEVAEKHRISPYASNGLYYFSSGKELVKFGEIMIQNNERIRNEFYIIPVYQKMIDAGKLVLLSHAIEMWDLGTPDAKASFEHFILNR